MDDDELALFPLRTVLFPEGLLALKIFEARYLDLMTRCMRDGSRFGVVALRAGGEARSADDEGSVRLHEVGTTAELIDVDSAEAGILHVRCRGRERFRVGATRQQRDGLWLARTEPVAADLDLAPDPRHADAVAALAEAVAALAAQGASPFLGPHRFDSAAWVANRWCEILPLPLEVRQRLLTLADPLTRLDVVASLLRSSSEAN